MQIEQDAERKAQQDKRKFIEQVLEKLAAQEKEALFPPQRHRLQPGEAPTADADDNRR
ncbi:MAG: hypothetical protein RLY93_05510 [Sumerlaeia bacterium]